MSHRLWSIKYAFCFISPVGTAIATAIATPIATHYMGLPACPLNEARPLAAWPRPPYPLIANQRSPTAALQAFTQRVAIILSATPSAFISRFIARQRRCMAYRLWRVSVSARAIIVSPLPVEHCADQSLKCPCADFRGGPLRHETIRGKIRDIARTSRLKGFYPTVRSHA